MMLLGSSASVARAQEEPGGPPPQVTPDQSQAVEPRNVPVDAVFLVDSSASIFRTDPDKARQVLIEAFSGFVWARPGDRVAVAQFAGWEETKKNLAVAVPLVEIPSEYAARKALMDDMRAKLGGMKPFGSATDMNAALEIALGEVERSRGEAAGKPLWAVVITDGDFDVVEGDSAREEYIAKAEASYPPVGPDTLSRAASDIFFEKTLPELKQRGITISFVALGCSPDSLGEFFRRAGEAAECRVLCTKDLRVRDMFVDLLRSCPARDNSDIPSYGFSRATVEAGGQVLVPLRVLPGTSRTRAALFATSAAFAVSLTTPDGVAIDAPKLTALGEGTPFRVAWIDEARPGEYALKIVNKGEGPIDVEFAVFGEVSLRLQIAWPEESDAHLMGAPAAVVASLSDTDGNPVGDQPTLLETRLTLEITDGQGNTQRSVSSFEGAEDGKLKAKVTTDNLAPGPATVTARMSAYPLPAPVEGAQASFIYVSPEQEHVFNLLPGVMVEFVSPDAFVKQRVRLVAKCSANVVNPPEAFSVALEPEASAAFTREGEGYVGTTSFDTSGTWKLLKGRDPAVLFAPGEVSKVTVRDRTMRVRGAQPPHDELKAVEYPVKFLEATGTGDGATPPYGIPVVIEMDAAEGEQIVPGAIAFTASADLIAKRLAADVVSFAFVGIEPTDRHDRVKATMQLSINSDAWLPTKLGAVEATASVVDVPASARLQVTLSFVDFWEKLFWKYLYYWAPVAGLLALLLLSLVWIALRNRFKYHQLRPVATLGKQEYLLRGMGGVSSARDAFGTPEVDSAVQFRIRGHRPFSRRGRVRVKILMDEAKVAVNGAPVADGWGSVVHGDEIVVSVGSEMKVAYWYFDREPTEAELEEKVKGFFVTLGPDEFVILGLD